MSTILVNWVVCGRSDKEPQDDIVLSQKRVAVFEALLKIF